MKLWAYTSSALAVFFLAAVILFQIRAADQAAQLREGQEDAALALTAVEEKAEAAEKQSQQLDRKLTELDRELAAAKARETTLGAQLRQAQLEARQLRETVAGLETDNQSLEDKLGRFRRELIEVKSQPAVLGDEERQQFEYEISELHSQLVALQNGLRHDLPVVVSTDILSISTRSDVIALNRGSSNGLGGQHTATLQRDGSPVARLFLQEVKSSFTIAHVLEQTEGQTLAKGSGYTLLIEP